MWLGEQLWQEYIELLWFDILLLRTYLHAVYIIVHIIIINYVNVVLCTLNYYSGVYIFSAVSARWIEGNFSSIMLCDSKADNFVIIIMRLWKFLCRKKRHNLSALYIMYIFLTIAMFDHMPSLLAVNTRWLCSWSASAPPVCWGYSKWCNERIESGGQVYRQRNPSPPHRHQHTSNYIRMCAHVYTHAHTHTNTHTHTHTHTHIEWYAHKWSQTSGTWMYKP